MISLYVPSRLMRMNKYWSSFVKRHYCQVSSVDISHYKSQCKRVFYFSFQVCLICSCASLSPPFFPSWKPRPLSFFATLGVKYAVSPTFTGISSFVIAKAKKKFVPIARAHGGSHLSLSWSLLPEEDPSFAESSEGAPTPIKAYKREKSDWSIVGSRPRNEIDAKQTQKSVKEREKYTPREMGPYSKLFYRLEFFEAFVNVMETYHAWDSWSLTGVEMAPPGKSTEPWKRETRKTMEAEEPLDADAKAEIHRDS